MKKNLYIFFFFLILTVTGLFNFFNARQINTDSDNSVLNNNDQIINPDTIKNVKYVSKDQNGNEYIIAAEEGEINFSNRDIIFLKKINAKLIMKDKSIILIESDFGKYNVVNYDTILNKNIIITKEDLKIYGNTLEFSLIKNLIIVSENVILDNKVNFLKADVIEMNLITKDIKVYMFEKNNKVKITSIN